MRIEIRGRNVEMTDELRETVRKRFQRLGRLKGVTLHARECSPEMTHSVRELAEDMSRQVKKHRELRRKRRRTRKLVDQMRGRPAEARP